MADPAYIVDGVLTDGEAWVGISTTTLGSDAATVTFTSTDDGQVGDWSQYMDLVLISYARSAAAVTTGQFNMRFNNDAGSNYTMQTLYGNGANAYAAIPYARDKFFLGDIPGNNATANVFGAYVVNMFDINSGKYKSLISQQALDLDGSASGKVRLSAGVWESQAPITEIDLTDLSGPGDIAAASSFSLFGVLPRMVA